MPLFAKKEFCVFHLYGGRSYQNRLPVIIVFIY